MLKIIFFIFIFFELWLVLEALKRCNFENCNHEGECYLNEANEKICKCIGQKYFKGPDCSETIDNCQIENPCKNNGKCYPLVGQFICQDCMAGYGGLRCDIKVANIFKNMILYFNHYGFNGQMHKFLIMVESLGEKAFALEFVSNKYAIDSWETEPLQQQTKWIYSENLIKIITNNDIRYYKDLPYTKGFYHLSTQTFWDLGELELHLRSYDSESGQLLFYQQQFQLLIVNEKTDECVPSFDFIHGLNPLDPLKVDIAVYNSFEVIVQKTCFKKSRTQYQWSVWNSIGSLKLHDFGSTKETILKVPPYKFWFNYQGEVMASYRLVVRMIEEYNGNKVSTEARCFILVLPKPIFALIKGGNNREIGVKQMLILDASSSRDYALDPTAKQDLIFSWHCISNEDADNEYCMKNMGSTAIIKMQASNLKVQASYNFTLNINSKVNKFVYDEAYQVIKITEMPQLLIDIQCLRNCERNQYIKDDLLHLKAVSQDIQLTEQALYKWSYNEQVIGHSEHLVYKGQDLVSVVDIKVLVEDVNEEKGQSVLHLKENLAPTGGFCTITPKEGEAFKTQFHIKCGNYQDVDTPLSYEYLAEDGFPLQFTNDEHIFIKLPKTSRVTINICDQFKACAINNLQVKVKDFEKPKDLKKFLKNDETGLKRLLFKGDILTAMVLLKSLALSLNNIELVSVIIEEMRDFSLLTLLQVQQFMEISSALYENNLPLDATKIGVLNDFLSKLHMGFSAAVKDNEIQSFTRLDYEKSTKDFMQIMSILSQTWQIIPPTQDETVTAIVSADNPLEEKYELLPDFNIDIAYQLENWLKSSEFLEKILNNFALTAAVLYKPLEHSYELEEENFHLKIYAFDNDTQQELKLNNNEVSSVLSVDLVKELQQQLKTKEILIQMAAFKNKPYWWYPDKTAISTPTFIFTAVTGRQTLKPSTRLKKPFEFKLKLNDVTLSTEYTEGVVKNYTHMPVYTLAMEVNALLIITFLKAQQSLKILVKFDQIPYSFEILKSGLEVKPSLEKQVFVFHNNLHRKTKAYLALMLEQPGVNVTYNFTSEINECLYWDYNLRDPQWSGRGCRPQLAASTNQSLSCFCHHFSTFGGKSYVQQMQPDLKERVLLQDLPFNWLLLAFYLVLILIFLLILLINFFNYKNYKNILPLNHSVDPQNTMEIHILTGFHLNATTTANITLRLISRNGPFSITITQNPFKPFLQRNSLFKIRLSPHDISLPLKLSLTNDLSGRYPSWYCHKIRVINLESQQQQTFFVNRWVNQQTLEISSTDLRKSKFVEHFKEHVSVIYSNWFQFQPLWGCWRCKDLNRLERCCISLAQLMVTLCLLACYFGPTTMETYELERDLYNNLSFNIFQLFLLSIICYIITFIIKLFFLGCFWLVDSVTVKQSSTSTKFF